MKLHKGVFAPLMVLMATSGITHSAELYVSPDKCVAMRKGQVCYQKLYFKFSAPITDSYCLLPANEKQPIQCWNSVREGSFRHLMAADASVEYVLVNSDSKVIASTNVAVAWVYKKSRKRSRWRLF